MVKKNRYYSRSRITEKTFRPLIRSFSLDLSASDTARLTGIRIRVRSVNRIDIKLRQRLAQECEQQALSWPDKVKWTNPTLAQNAFEAREAEAQEVKPLYWVSLNAMAGSLLKECPMFVNARCKR